MNVLETSRTDITNFMNCETQLPDEYDYEGTCARLIFEYDASIIDELSKQCNEYNITSIKIIDSYGGEGDGDQYWYIIEVEHNNGTIALVKLDGYYASYVGHKYSEWFFVKPVQVMVTKYVKNE